LHSDNGFYFAKVIEKKKRKAMSRDDSIYMAKLSEQAERYEDMTRWMKNAVINSSDDLSWEESNLLSIAFRNTIGALRTAWRVISWKKDKEESKGHQGNVTLINDSIKKVESK